MKHILLWSFAVFFSFAGSGLALAAHCHNNGCETETQQPASHHHDDNAGCHLHRLTVDNSIITAQKSVPDTKLVWLSDYHFLNTGEIHYINVLPRVISSSPPIKIANRDLLAVVSCLII
ncbi:MAG: hypothetical protein LBR75_00620 [Prevotellaceae bacterium]|nr:hypothetical protein [Prevotellaceae bacterium]